MVSGAVIETRQLTKRYGSARGIEDVDLHVEPGEVFGFLGPNGAGKLTTIRTLLDFQRPTSGWAALFGLDSRWDSVAIRGSSRIFAGRPEALRAHDRGAAPRVVRPCAGHERRVGDRRPGRAVRYRNESPGRGVVEGQPAEGRLVARVRARPRAGDPRRADLGPRSPDAGRVRATGAGHSSGRPHDPAVIALARRSATPRRPGRDHP